MAEVHHHHQMTAASKSLAMNRHLSLPESGYCSEDGFAMLQPRDVACHVIDDDDAFAAFPKPAASCYYDPLDLTTRSFEPVSRDQRASNFHAMTQCKPATRKVFYVDDNLAMTSRPDRADTLRKLSSSSQQSSAVLGQSSGLEQNPPSAFKPFKSQPGCRDGAHESSPIATAPHVLDFVGSINEELHNLTLRPRDHGTDLTLRPRDHDFRSIEPPPSGHQLTVLPVTSTAPHDSSRATSRSSSHHHRRHSSSSARSGDQSLTAVAAKLYHVIDSVSGKELKRLLRDRLDTKHPDVIKAMQLLLPASVMSDDDHRMSHCVRCHKSFDPSERTRCYVPHPESMVTMISQDDEGSNFVCECCKSGFRLLKMNFYEESTNSLLTGHCFSGHHTTDSAEVEYLARGGAARSCADRGCSCELYV